MSRDWAADIAAMHDNYGFIGIVEAMSPALLSKLLEFRKDFLLEEMKEIGDAIDERDSDGVVDGLIDLCVVAIGTLDLMGVDAHAAWDEVHRRNMEKERGVKPNRPNPLGMPDLIKPEGWIAPSHAGNTGRIDAALAVSE